MTTDGFHRRLRKVTQDDGLGDLNLTNPRDVDRASRALLARFRAHDDGRAFDLLVELTEPFLRESARHAARHIGLALDPDELVVAFFSNLFIDQPRRLPDTPRFLEDAAEQLREEAAELVEEVAELVIDADEGARPRLYAGPLPQAVAKLEAPFQRCVAVCFHRLPLDERRVLRAIDLERLDVNAAALALGIPAPELRRIESRARRHLAEALDRSTGRSP